jgi:hypothetical protein
MMEIEEVAKYLPEYKKEQAASRSRILLQGK